MMEEKAKGEGSGRNACLVISILTMTGRGYLDVAVQGKAQRRRTTDKRTYVSPFLSSLPYGLREGRKGRNLQRRLFHLPFERTFVHQASV